MRIIGGKYKGKKIQAPKGLRARPTTDFAKESLFNILNNLIDLEDLDVLDLFSGTGNISYEFVSRGASKVWSVEMDRKSCDFIRKYADTNELSELKVVKANAYQFLKTVSVKFDVVYADPPYGHKHVATLHEKLLEADILKEDGMIIIEHGPETDYSDSTYLMDHRKYGHVHFSFFKPKSS